MQRLLAILHRLNGMYLDDEETDVEIGEELATRADFEGLSPRSCLKILGIAHGV
jgi:hypothetical protein